MVGLQELVLELTDQCPLRCRHCSSNSGPECSNHLPASAVHRLVWEAAELGASKISFGGGEPAISPNLLPTLQTATKAGLAAEVFTSGAIAAQHGIDHLPQHLVRSLAKIPGVTVIFSIHGPDPATHDAITGTPGSFQCMVDAITACLREGIARQGNFVPLRSNYSQFADVIRLATQLGLSRLSVLRFVPQGRGMDNRAEIELSPREEDEFVSELLRIRSHGRIDVRTGSPFNGIVPGNAVPCRAGGAKLVVQADGNVLPCEVFKHSARCSWGLSIHQHKLADILASAQMRSLQGSLAAKNCLECPVHAALRIQRSGGMPYAREEEAVPSR